jgi:hypothetical protein
MRVRIWIESFRGAYDLQNADQGPGLWRILWNDLSSGNWKWDLERGMTVFLYIMFFENSTKRIRKYELDLVGIHGVRKDKSGTEP